MGAYLSSPVRDNVSEDSSSPTLQFGASSMQGWRISQEDAHNCLPDFDADTKTSLFAVYDGHGGAEVAQYTAMNLPDFIKAIDAYKSSKLEAALEEAFLGFDETLTGEEVLKELKVLAGVNIESEDEEGENETAMLFEEADMPLEKLLERYGGQTHKGVAALKKKGTVQSPCLHAKTDKASMKNEASDVAGSAKPDATHDNSDKTDIKMKLEERLVNGQSDNENNENMEKEYLKREEDSIVRVSKMEADSTEKKPETVESSNSSQASAKSPAKAANVVHTSTDDTSPSLTTDVVHTSTDDASRSLKSDVVHTSTDSTSQSPKGGSVVHTSTDDTSQSRTADVVHTSTDATSQRPKFASEAEAICSSTVGPARSNAQSSAEVSQCSGHLHTTCSEELQEPQPSSSSGRTHKRRKNIIPEEDEDESSFTETDSSEEEEEEDEEGQWVSSDDDSDECDDCEGDHVCGEDDDEEEEIMTGGEEPGVDSGCTAVVALLRGRQLYVANAGDSRCVICRDGKAIDMSVDHKPDDEIEQNRISKAGGRVTLDGRVNGGLNLSRAIGDHAYKKNKALPAQEQMITVLPDVKTLTLEDKDEFMVLACDGIWNVMSSEDAVSFVRERLRSGVEKLSSICEEMFDFCLAPDTTGDGTGCDNMTCIIVLLGEHYQTTNTSKRRASSEPDESLECKKIKTDN